MWGMKEGPALHCLRGGLGKKHGLATAQLLQTQKGRSPLETEHTPLVFRWCPKICLSSKSGYKPFALYFVMCRHFKAPVPCPRCGFVKPLPSLLHVQLWVTWGQGTRAALRRGRSFGKQDKTISRLKYTHSRSPWAQKRVSLAVYIIDRFVVLLISCITALESSTFQTHATWN